MSAYVSVCKRERERERERDERERVRVDVWVCLCVDRNVTFGLTWNKKMKLKSGISLGILHQKLFTKYSP